MSTNVTNQDSIPGINDFHWNDDPEPHIARKKVILKAHKEITTLMGHDSNQKYFAMFTVLLQLTMAYYCGQSTCPWWVFVSVAWVIGGTCVHSLTLAIHELTHHLFFKKRIHNVYFSYFCNLPFMVPYAASFKKYHLEHHKKQGSDVLDTDIPTAWEGRFFRTPFRKFLWVFFQAFFYALRPLLVNPKPPNKWDLLNLAIQLPFNVIIYYYMGAGSVGYLLLSLVLGLGPHPCAGHFIGEHYTNIWTGDYGSNSAGHNDGWSPIKNEGNILQIDETFTYRGPLNLVSYNVGYHTAHHDFPNVPGFRLPQVEKMAPEYYRHVPECKSWPGTIWRYIFSEGNPFDRVKRDKYTKPQSLKKKK